MRESSVFSRVCDFSVHRVEERVRVRSGGQVVHGLRGWVRWSMVWGGSGGLWSGVAVVGTARNVNGRFYLHIFAQSVDYHINL